MWRTQKEERRISPMSQMMLIALNNAHLLQSRLEVLKIMKRKHLWFCQSNTFFLFCILVANQKSQSSYGWIDRFHSCLQHKKFLSGSQYRLK